MFASKPKTVTKPVRKTILLAPHAKQIVRNLIMLKDGSVLAGYRIGAARWDFTGKDAKIMRMNQDADVFAALVGRSYHERVTTRPHPVATWAGNLDKRTPHPTPDVHVCDLSMNQGDLLNGRCGCETWGKHLIRMQDVIARSGMNDKIVFRYFGLNVKVSPRTDLRKQINEFLKGGKPSAAVAALIADEKRVSDIVTGWPGSQRMSEYEQGWLRVRSLSPGVIPTGIHSRDRGGWDELALPALASDTRWAETPFGRTVSVTSFVGGKQVDTAVRVLTMARMADLNYPENGMPPWQVHGESVLDASGRPFPVEWSVVGRLRSGEELAKEVEFELRRVRHVKGDYQEHNEFPPSNVDKAIGVAVETRDQVTTGQAAVAARFQGQINVVITGQATEHLTAEQVVEERCAAFIQMYSSTGLRMDFAGSDSQSFMLASTVPGEPHDRLGFQRRLRLPFLTAGMPNVTAAIGDGLGPYLGHTRGASRRPVMHDPHLATEGLRTGRSQNMHLVEATLGGGKSVLLGSVGYNAVRRGVRTVISDPSGPLAVLCHMPEIAAVSQEINLLNGARGILSPAALIRDPLLTEFDEPGQYAEALGQAAAERRDLMVDMAKRCLPDYLLKGEAEARTEAALRLAARQHADRVGWSQTSTMWDLMRPLKDGDDWAKSVHGALVDASTAPLLRLMFPEPGAPGVASQYDKTLTVITTPGIVRAVDGTPRKDWNPLEVGADVVLRLVGLFTDRLIYSKARSERCIAIFDEAESLTDFGPGRSMLSRLGRDHSKWNTAVYLGVKSVSDQMLSGELKNFLASVFVGRMASREPAEKALELLGLTDKQYAQVLMGLSTYVPGEFVHADVAGNVGMLKVDVDYHPALKAALLTDPTPEGSGHWDLTEENA